MGAGEHAAVPQPWKLRSLLHARTGAESVSNAAELSARDPETFSANFVHSLLRSIHIAMLDAPSHRGTRTSKIVHSDPSNSVSLVFTRTGSMTVHQDGRMLVAEPGTLFLLRSRTVYRYSAESRVSIVAVTIPTDTLPLGLVRNLRTMTARPLTASVLTRSALAYIEALVSSSRTPTDVEARQLEHQVLLLVSGLIAENFSSPSRGPGTDSTFLAAAALSIAANSSNRGYSPHDVAAATGIDLRTLYRIFRTENVGIAELIRDTRLQHICAALADPSNRCLFSDLATQSGFSGVDQAARAFRRKYGMSMRAYRTSRRP